MAKDRSLVKASDLGAWAFCNRAWWLAEVEGVQHTSPQVLARGTDAHQIHGRQVRQASRLTTLGLILIVAGLAAIALLLFWQLAA